MEKTSAVVINERVREIVKELDVNLIECLAIIKNIQLIINKDDINKDTQQALQGLLSKIKTADLLIGNLLDRETWREMYHLDPDS
jgi:hypothetical protein